MIDDLEWLLQRQCGVISRVQARRLLSDAFVRRELANRRWQVAHRGIYVTTNGDLSRVQRNWVGILVAGAGQPSAPLAGLSALNSSGLRGYPTDLVDVYADGYVKNPPRFVRCHRCGPVPATAVQLSRNPPRTSLARAVIDAARWSPSDVRARAIIAASVQQRLVRPKALIDAVQQLSRLRRSELITATIQDTAGGSESISELDFLRLCRTGALPMPSRQTVVRDADGRNRYRDAHFEEWKLHVEIDGSQHMDVASWWADMQRQNAMWIEGERILRFPAWAIRNEPQKVIETVRAALVAAGWRPEQR